MGKNKIVRDDGGKPAVNFVPKVFEKWKAGKSAAEIGRMMKAIQMAGEVGNEEFLARFDFLATEDEIREWEEGLSVSSKEQ